MKTIPARLAGPRAKFNALQPRKITPETIPANRHERRVTEAKRRQQRKQKESDHA